jgi:hypothetical protein
MELSLGDMFAPVEACPDCGGDLLLEPSNFAQIEEGLLVRC